MSDERAEVEIKVRGELDIGPLLARGAELLGQGVQKDYYLAGLAHSRVREEQGQFTLTEKAADVGTALRVRRVTSQSLSAEEAQRLIKSRGVRVLVCKERTSIRFRDVLVRLDEVEHLGDFVEISGSEEASVTKALADLGLGDEPPIRASYLELMSARALPGWLQFVLRWHDRVGELTFGITSGILTTVGVLVGVNSATSERLPVIAAIVSIAVADSCSDAFGIYLSKASERGSSPRQALRLALGTLAGKSLLPLTFVGPLLLLPLTTAIWVNLAWAAFALTLLSIEQALVEQQPLWRRIARNLGLAIVIVINSLLAGWAVASLR